jgi:dihydroflavonol-4-reductase
MKNFIEDIGEDKFREIELVGMDLTNKDSIMNAFKGVTHVVHVASPFNPAEFTKYEDFVNPVIEGTKAVTEACKINNVKKLVVTSSNLTVMASMSKG